MAVRYLEVVKSTTQIPPSRVNANAAAVYSDGTSDYALHFDKNGTFKEVADQDNVGSLVNGASNTAKGAYKTAVVALNGTTIHGAVQSWANPEAGSIAITEVVLSETTASTVASALDIGTTAVSATTASDNLIDGAIVSDAAPAVFDNNTDKGANGKTRQVLASGKWVTFADDATGNVSGFVGEALITYLIL